MTTHVAHHSRFGAPPDGSLAQSSGFLWPAAAALLAGAVSFVSTDVLALSREAFLVPYVFLASALGVAFVSYAHVDVSAAVRRNPMRTVAVTIVMALLTIGTVMLQPGAPRAQGAQLAFQLTWDGAAYGAVDGFLLTVIPISAVRHALRTTRWTTDALALLASVGVFLVYHLGFAEFRSTAIAAPIVAGLIFGAAYLLSRNPLAPILAHAAMHIAAVLHGPAGTVQLPPHY